MQKRSLGVLAAPDTPHGLRTLRDCVVLLAVAKLSLATSTARWLPRCALPGGMWTRTASRLPLLDHSFGLASLSSIAFDYMF